MSTLTRRGARAEKSVYPDVGNAEGFLAPIIRTGDRQDGDNGVRKYTDGSTYTLSGTYTY